MKSDPLSRAARVRSDAYVFLGKKLWPGSVRAFACSVCAGQHSSPPDSRGYAPPMPKTRLDSLLVQRGLFETRSRAAAAVLAGTVRVGDDGRRADKPGQFVASDVELRIDEPPPFVSRGGVKLANALDAFGVDPAGRRCLDVGASTGGFTDCLLQTGAAHVVALDVAYGELAWGLRGDDRVSVRERLNARHLRADDLPYEPDLITID